MSLINVVDLTFSYDGSYQNVFENVSLQIDSEWKLGLVGRNGRGKTTFLQLLMGRYSFHGKITASVVFDYFPFEVGDKSKVTIEVLEEIYPEIIQWQIEKELSLLQVDLAVLYLPFKSLSHGERTKVLLAVLFLKPNRFLLIDEPTDNLDLAAREIVSRYLKKKSGYILVSHDRQFLDKCIEYVLSINRNNIEIQKGNFTTWWQNKESKDQSELEQNERLKIDIKRLAEASRQASNWSDKKEKSKIGAADKGFVGHKAAKMMKRSKSIEARKDKGIAEKKELLKNIEEKKQLKIFPIPYMKRRLLNVEQLSIVYHQKVLCKNLNFQIEQGDRIALVGKNGSGKSSVLKALLGENNQYTGTVHVGSGLKISYVPQDTSFLTGFLKEFAQNSNLNDNTFRSVLEYLGFEKEQFDRDLSGFSSGQKKKILLARSLCEEAHLYIWDEPLNFVDVISREQIEELILKFCPTMIFVEHDEAFARKVATKQVVL